MRNYVILYINGQQKKIYGEQIYRSLSDYLRDDLLLKGTKIVCEEGDCGACTVLKLSPTLNSKTKNQFISINSCITFLYLLDCCHIITIEALKNDVQSEFIKNNSSQCGFCTPGFVMSMTALKNNTHMLCEKEIRNGLTGNLCRCTGYAQIIDAGLSLTSSPSSSPSKNLMIDSKYYAKEIISDLEAHQLIPIEVKSDKKVFKSPLFIKDALNMIASKRETTVFLAATDLGVQLNKTNKKIKNTLSLNLVEELHQIKKVNNQIEIGAKVTLAQLQIFLKDQIPEVSDLLNIFASPQIKNTGTLVGNIANASPIGDTLPFLMVLEAKLELQGIHGKHLVEINNFYLGYKQLNLKENELITKVILPLLTTNKTLKLYKVSKRKDLDISCVTAAFLIEKNDKSVIDNIKICYGGVGPTVIRLLDLEQKMKGKIFNQATINDVVKELRNHITPMSDVRGSSEYRYLLAKNLFKKFFFDISKRASL